MSTCLSPTTPIGEPSGCWGEEGGPQGPLQILAARVQSLVERIKGNLKTYRNLVDQLEKSPASRKMTNKLTLIEVKSFIKLRKEQKAEKKELYKELEALAKSSPELAAEDLLREAAKDLDVKWDSHLDGEPLREETYDHAEGYYWPAFSRSCLCFYGCFSLSRIEQLEYMAKRKS